MVGISFLIFLEFEFNQQNLWTQSTSTFYVDEKKKEQKEKRKSFLRKFLQKEKNNVNDFKRLTGYHGEKPMKGSFGFKKTKYNDDSLGSQSEI
jgi:hypothetical protein